MYQLVEQVVYRLWKKVFAKTRDRGVVWRSMSVQQPHDVNVTSAGLVDKSAFVEVVHVGIG